MENEKPKPFPLQPAPQKPAEEERDPEPKPKSDAPGDLALFESGAIVFHIAEHHADLLPQDANARARAIMWMFAALSTMEPAIVQREIALYLERDRSWHEQRLPIVEDRIRGRLRELSDRLGNADWLDAAFSAGDLMMVQVLRRLKSSSLLEEYPSLSAYVARGEARPAFKRAFDAQWAVFTGKPASSSRNG